MENNEIWKDIIGYEGNYMVSNLGNVKSLPKRGHNHEKLIKPWIKNTGRRVYNAVSLCVDAKVKKFTIHQLVATTFLGHKPDGTNKIVVDHINNDSLDNRVENLQLISNRKNCSKDKKGGTSKYVGVHFCKKVEKWVAVIQINGKSKNLGLFKTEEEASQRYQDVLNIINKI
jgi:hypothetical protein